jgi:hypothetical protein
MILHNDTIIIINYLQTINVQLNYLFYIKANINNIKPSLTLDST